MNTFHLINQQRIIISATVVVLLVMMVGGVLTQLVNHSSYSRSATRSSSVTRSSGSVVAHAGAVRTGYFKDMNIANTGRILVRGATVLSVTPETIRVGMSWGAADFTWRLTINSETKFFSSKGAPAAMTDIYPGDIVTVTGMLVRNGSEGEIKSDFIREQ